MVSSLLACRVLIGVSILALAIVALVVPAPDIQQLQAVKTHESPEPDSLVTER